MTPGRLTLLLSPALLLAACGQEPGEAQGQQPEGASAPFGFELAMMRVGADGETATAPAPASSLVALSPEELAAKLAEGNIRLIDVRTDAEVAEGTIPGAEHIPLDRFDPAALDLSDGREVVLYCRSGRRSAMAGEELAAHTGAPVEHLDGGILAWEAAGQPVAKQP